MMPKTLAELIRERGPVSVHVPKGNGRTYCGKPVADVPIEGLVTCVSCRNAMISARRKVLQADAHRQATEQITAEAAERAKRGKNTPQRAENGPNEPKMSPKRPSGDPLRPMTASERARAKPLPEPRKGPKTAQKGPPKAQKARKKR